MKGTSVLTGHQLMLRRMDARVKAKDLAARLEVSSSRISRLEREQFPDPQFVSRYLTALEECRNVPSTERGVA